MALTVSRNQNSRTHQSLRDAPQRVNDGAGERIATVNVTAGKRAVSVNTPRKIERCLADGIAAV